MTWLAACTPAPSPEPATAQPERGARLQPGTQLGIYLPEQHDLYDGRFIITGQRVYQVGTLSDASPWDHMGDDASTVREVGGTIEIDVDEIQQHRDLSSRVGAAGRCLRLVLIGHRQPPVPRR